MAIPLTKDGLPDVQVLRKTAREQIIDRLKSLPGKKDLFLDPELMRPLDRIAGASLLKEHGVDKIYKLESAKSMGSNTQRLYIVRPRMLTMKYIADQINSEKNTGDKKKYKIVFVPRKLHVCDRILETEGVYGDILYDDFHLDLIPLDKDVLSLEQPEFLRSHFMDGDQTWCHTIARSLVNLQQLFGLIPNIYKLGKCGQIIHQMTELMFEYYGQPGQLNSQIGHLFLIDREIDYVTPLCSQVTYEGLLNDVIGISAGLINFGQEVTGKEGSVQMLLTSADQVFDDIRNKHFSHVSAYLSSKAKQLQTGYDKRHDMTVSQMKDYVASELRDLKQQHKSLALHVSACELITKKKTEGEFTEELRAEHNLLEGIETKETLNYIEEMIHRQVTPNNILRLLCLASLTQDGLSPQVYKQMKTQFCHSHGFEHMLTFHNLKKQNLLWEKEQPQPAIPSPTKPLGSKQIGRHLGKVTAAMGSLSSLPKKSPFRGVAKKLNLIPRSAEDVNLRDPNDMSYVFSGAYTPLSCKLVEQVLQKEGFIGLEEIVKSLPAPCSADVKAKSARGGRSGQDTSSRVVLVYFLGGCTHSEISALRFLGQHKGYKFLIATTAIINSSSLLDSVKENTENI